MLRQFISAWLCFLFRWYLYFLCFFALLPPWHWCQNTKINIFFKSILKQKLNHKGNRKEALVVIKTLLHVSASNVSIRNNLFPWLSALIWPCKLSSWGILWKTVVLSMQQWLNSSQITYDLHKWVPWLSRSQH